MNQHSSNKRKYYSPLIGAALAAVSLFHFSLPTFAAGTEAGQVLRNTATGSYTDDAGNPYSIESNTVDVTVAKVAGITNMPTGITDNTSTATNTTVLTGDSVSFEFTITNVGNDLSNIFVPDLTQIPTKGIDRTTLTIETSQVNPGGSPTFTDRTGASYTEEDVPINGQIIVKVTGNVSATAAGAPIEVLLGDTGSNLDPNAPVTDTQNQPDTDGGDTGGATDVQDVRTETASNPTVTGAPIGGQKEASALQQVLLGSNPLAMTKIEKTRGAMQPGTDPNALNDNIIPYSLELEVLTTTPNSFFTPGDLEGRDYASRITGITAADAANLVLVSDAIPVGSKLAANLTQTGDWTPVYTTENGLADQINWTTTAPANQTARDAVTRVGWVYDARATPDGDGPIPAGTVVTAAQGGFTFNVITSDLDPVNGGTIANIAQVFGSTVNGADIFDESGDQDPSNFNGTNQGPDEDDPQSTGIADPATHEVDSNNDNTADPSPGGEDNVITIGAPGQLINGPEGQPAATGDVFGVGPDNNHDFQNKGVEDFVTDLPNAQHNAGDTFDPESVSFTNTLSNPGTLDLTDVLLQPINPEFNPAYNGTVEDTDLPANTEVTLTLGGQTATYTYQVNPANPTDPDDLIFVLTAGTPITIPTLSAGVPLDYTVDVDLPPGTGLSTDDSINQGFAVPIIAFIDEDPDGAGPQGPNGSPDVGENNNLTVNQVYTGHIKVSKQVRVLDADGNLRAGMDFPDADTAKQPVPGDILEYRVIYRNISEPQSGTGNNVVLNGVDVMIDENGTVDLFDGAPTSANGDPTPSGNNWALDNNGDTDIDTINVQGSATDSNNGTITFYTGEAATIDTLAPSGTVDPGDTVTGYRSTVPLLAPTGAEDIVTTPALINNADAGDSTFTFRRKVDEFDGVAPTFAE